MIVVGVDGTKTGWVAARTSDDGPLALTVHATFADVMAAHADAKTIAVDMPVGLLDDGATRACDRAVKRALGRHGARLFLVPPRPIVDEHDYARALARCRARHGGGFSKQAFQLFAKIREVDAFVDDARVNEVHPELSFAVMNGGAPVAASKKTWNGLMARRALLAAHGLGISDDVGPAGGAPADDVVDAVAAAFTARRVAQGRARRFPDEDEARSVERDRGGRALVIVA